MSKTDNDEASGNPEGSNISQVRKVFFKFNQVWFGYLILIQWMHLLVFKCWLITNWMFVSDNYQTTVQIPLWIQDQMSFPF